MKFKVCFFEWCIINGTEIFDDYEEAVKAGKYYVSGNPTSRSFSIDICK